MFLNMAHALAVFDIRPVKDANGVACPPPVAWEGVHIRCVSFGAGLPCHEYTCEMLSELGDSFMHRRPCAFQCEIVARSAEKAELGKFMGMATER